MRSDLIPRQYKHYRVDFKLFLDSFELVAQADDKVFSAILN